MQLQSGDELSNGIRVGNRTTEFVSLGDIYWGMRDENHFLLVEITTPTYLRVVDHRVVKGVFAYDVVNGHRGGQIVVYSHKDLKLSEAISVGSWLSRASDITDCKRRLLKLVEFVQQLESEAQFFFPFLCARSMVVLGDAEKIGLLGAPVDLRNLSDQHLPSDVKRSIDPAYLAYRNISGDGKSPRPDDEKLRKRYLRFGLTHIIAETAYGKVISDRDDAMGSELTADWDSIKGNLQQHANLEHDTESSSSPWESRDDYFNVLIAALRPLSPEPSPAVQEAQREPTGSHVSGRPVDQSLQRERAKLELPALDKITSSAESEPQKKIARGRFILFCIAGLLAGVLLATGLLQFLNWWDFRNPDQLKQLQVQQLLSKWMADSTQRSEVESEMESRGEGANINLVFLKLLHTRVSVENRVEIARQIESLKDQLGQLKNSDGQIPGAPNSPMFTKNDLDVLLSLTNPAGTER